MMADPIPVDENGNPIAAPPAAVTGRAPIPVDENGQPLAAAANEPSIAARANAAPTPSSPTNALGMGPHLDASGQPEYLTPALTPEQDANVRAGGNLVARTLLRANPVLAIPNALFTGTQEALNAASSKLGGPTKDVFNPVESGIHALGLDMAPDASQPMRIADAVAPWLVPTGNQVGRVQEAPGLWNKATTLGRSEIGNLVDWAASDEAQQWAQAHGFGSLAQTIAGMVGGNARQGAARVVAAPATRAVVPAKPDAGAAVDVNKALLPPDGSTVSTTPPFKDVADPNSSIANFISGAGAIPFSGTGEASAVKAQTGAIARTADAGLNALDPGTTPVTAAGPSSLKDESSTLANQARDKMLTEEHQLMANSDAIDSQIGDTRTDATPLRTAAENLYTDPNVGTTVQTQAKKILDSINANTAPDGSIGYGALKNERSAFGQFVDGLYTAPAGDITVKNTLARALQPIKDAMSQTMGAAADAAGAATGNPDLGDQLRQNDAAWSTHGAIKHQLADIGGTLNQARTGFDPAPGGKKVASILANSVTGGGQGLAPIINIEQGLGEQPARSAVAETIASMGTPKKAKSDYAFQPSTFGKGVQSVDPDVMSYIEQKAGSEARQNIENAGAAGAGTSQPPKQGGLRRAMGGVLSALPYVAPAAAFGHTGAALSPLVAMLTSATNDPDFIRTVANRNVPLTSAELAQQLATHAALGASPSRVDPQEALRYGVGQAANAVGTGVQAGVGLVPTLLKYINSAASQQQQGGQR